MGGACWASGVASARAWQDGAESRTGAVGVVRHEEVCLEEWESLRALTLARPGPVSGPGWAEEAEEVGDSEHLSEPLYWGAVWVWQGGDEGSLAPGYWTEKQMGSAVWEELEPAFWYLYATCVGWAP